MLHSQNKYIYIYVLFFLCDANFVRHAKLEVEFDYLILIANMRLCLVRNINI